MFDSLNSVLPVFIYVLLIIFIIVGIILGIKLIITIDKVNVVVDDINNKVKSLDYLFSIISGVTNKFELISSKVTDIVLAVINKISSLKKGKEESEDNE